jgi:hypothetical protein
MLASILGDDFVDGVSPHFLLAMSLRMLFRPA